MAPAADSFWHSSGFGFAEPPAEDTPVQINTLLITLLALLPGPGVAKPTAELAREAGTTKHLVSSVLVDAWLDGVIEFDPQTDTFFMRKQGNALPANLTPQPPRKDSHGPL